MEKSKRSFALVRWLSLWILLCFFSSGDAFALPWKEHVEVQNQYIWGLTTETSRAIHSDIIDKVPWRAWSEGYKGGGKNHRFLWGHSDDWFYHARLPKKEVLRDIEANVRRQYPSWSDKNIAAEVQRRYKEAVSMSGQERIARALMQKTPALKKAEAMEVAEQLHAAHILGDSTTREKLRDVDMERAKRCLRFPPKYAISGANKIALDEAMKAQGSKFSAASFARQTRNFEHLKAEFYSRHGFSIYNPPSREEIGIVVKWQNYIIKENWKDAVKAVERFPSAKVFLPDDVYARDAARYPNLAGKIVPESQVTGVKAVLAEQQDDITRIVAAEQDGIETTEAYRVSAMGEQLRQSRSVLRKLAPYALAGGLMAFSENWDVLKDAWDGKATWAKALTRTGVDFAGYTVTPYIIDGILAQVGGKSVIAATLKNAGMGYTLGYFVWSAGREYLAYQIGDISREEFVNHMKQRGAQAGREAAMIPVNMLVCKLVSPAAGTFVVPLVVIGGSFAIQRVQQWYEDKQWRETVYLEDVKSILGEGLMNQFTFLNPEKQFNLAEPENSANIATPEQNSSLIEPETRLNVAVP